MAANGESNGNGESNVGIVAAQVANVKERQDKYEESNSKEHADMNKRLDKVLEEALKRWPPALAALVAILSSVCTGLIVYVATHPGG